MNDPLLELDDVTVRYRVRDRDRARALALDAVRGVSLTVRPGESIGIVGESGSGKSTLARAALGLVPLHAGCVRWQGRTLATLPESHRRALRRHYQLVFQDPAGSLDPRMPLLASVREPLDIHEAGTPAAQRAARASTMLARVGLQGLGSRYPHELSGGQCQRGAIARAMVASPYLIVCDEALSALDVSIQRQIVELLAALQRESGIALVFIGHHLPVVQQLCQRVLVMYLGRVVEAGPVASVLAQPLHPYTRALLDAVPTLDPDHERARPATAAAAEPPSPFGAPQGCAFQTRCRYVETRCRERVPALSRSSGAREVACHRAAGWPEGLR
jgi:oligopeptide transport system ATP-binding protein